MKYLWKLPLVVWILATAALALLFGSIRLYGGSPEATELAGVLGRIWGGCAALYGWHLISAKWKAWSLRHADSKNIVHTIARQTSRLVSAQATAILGSDGRREVNLRNPARTRD
jgi:hypothetical protein